MYDRAPETLTEQRKTNIGNQAAHGAVVDAVEHTLMTRLCEAERLGHCAGFVVKCTAK